MTLFYSPGGGQNGSRDAYALLSRAVRSACGIDLPDIKKTENGKPYFPSRPDIHFSLSHTKTHVMCAVSNSPVGVDIETEREISARAVRFFASPDELDAFDPLDLWVLKESYIKLVGGRLLMAKTIRFSRQGDEIVAPGAGVTARLYRPQGCRAAVCTAGDAAGAAVFQFAEK